MFCIVCHTNGKTPLEVLLPSDNNDCNNNNPDLYWLFSFCVRAWFLRPIIDIDVINNRLNTVSLFFRIVYNSSWCPQAPLVLCTVFLEMLDNILPLLWRSNVCIACYFKVCQRCSPHAQGAPFFLQYKHILLSCYLYLHCLLTYSTIPLTMS